MRYFCNAISIEVLLQKSAGVWKRRYTTMYPSVKEVTPCDDYILSIVFENGENGQLDLKPILDFGIFQRIKDYESFKRVRVSFDTIEWDCGVDLDPEYVYTKCMEGKLV